MKTVLVLLILFSVIALPALGELTVEAIEKIDAKIKESETRMKEHMTQQVDILENACRMAYRYPCGCDRTHRYSFSCFDNHDRLAKRKRQLTRKNQ